VTGQPRAPLATASFRRFRVRQRPRPDQPRHFPVEGVIFSNGRVVVVDGGTVAVLPDGLADVASVWPGMIEWLDEEG
jgi:hypothetical protein